VNGFRDNGLPNFLVTNSFIKIDAWSKDTVSVRVLQHEQLHFDIAEVYARKIRQAVDSLRRINVKTIGTYSSEIKKLLAMRNETDSLYDEQTSHGVYWNEQLVWNQKILKELEALNNYAVKRQL
jgi:predicted secreted Zn-dependent protease